ncbi:MAG: hypothetical protein R2844_01625 [Caldilineales bacterium]
MPGLPEEVTESRRERPKLRDVLRAGVLRPPAAPEAVVEEPSALKRALQAYQSAMLQEDYADFAVQPKYTALTEFFFTSLYAPEDFGLRNDSFRKLHEWLEGILGRDPVRILAQAIELYELTDSLDDDMVLALRAMGVTGEVNAEAWEAAYRRVGRRRDRERQVYLIMDNARALALTTRVPLVGLQLRAFRPAAAVLGWGHVIDFLIEGHEALSRAAPVEAPLEALQQREEARIERLLPSGRQ